MPTDSDFSSEANKILHEGNPIKYILDSCSESVLGADKAFQKLICCVATQSINQSSGLHPKLSGESGSGKTYVLTTFAHHLPPEMVVLGSTSNLAVFYHNEVGSQVFRVLDDYRAGNEALDTIIKQTSSIFHEKYIHRTIKNQTPLTLTIGSEQTWCITSVDSSQDVQVLNRQLPINVNDTEDLTKKINKNTIKRYGEGKIQFPIDEKVLISRAMWQILRSEGLINIRIPFYDRIEWLDNTNRRNPSIFLDLLVAHTFMLRFQREKDKEGFYLATEEDFNFAKTLFQDKDAEELVHRLTRKEREMAGILKDHPSGLTRDELAKQLKISPSRISQLANGEKGKGGLSQKLTGFSIHEVTDHTNNRYEKKTIYKISGYDPLSGFDAIVTLKPASVEPVRPVSIQ